MAYFSPQIIELVWQKAKIVSGYDPNSWRKDFAGAWISRRAYGQQGPYGWEIDHLRPVVLHGSNELSNLNPLQWQNNKSKGDDFPSFRTSVTSDDRQNIDRIQSWKVG